MEEDLDIRQNKDLIQSLNEIYQMNIAIQKDMHFLKHNIESTNQSQDDKIRRLNSLVMESKNSMNQRLRFYQKDQITVNRSLDELKTMQIELDNLKNENQILKERIKDINNDMIDLQSHIIQDNSSPILSNHNPSFANISRFNINQTNTEPNDTHFSHESEIPVETYNNVSDVLNPHTRIK